MEKRRRRNKYDKNALGGEKIRTIKNMRRRGTIRGKSHGGTIENGREGFQKQWDMKVMKRRMR